MEKQGMIGNLSKQWQKCGIVRGDVLLVHSSLKQTFRRFLKEKQRITPTDILDSFLEAVGPNGTLLLPLFFFGFTKGETFDIRSTPSEMGVLTECGRQRPVAVRTGHPIYSFAVLGAEKERFRNVNNFSGYGADSPFAILRELDGKIAVLNLEENRSMTFYHHVEEMNEVPYRYHKVFKGEYIDFEGNKSLREYGLFVRDLECGVETDVYSMGELLWERGLYKGCRPDEGCGLRTVSARVLFDTAQEVIRSGKAKGMLCKILPELPVHKFQT